ncbi:FAD-dependent monooxygenase [Streptomyces sp. NPDC005760]|uniref:FAD-dependent monooxygenase n=1 Tax=Streptomyces sp. NPDC005760 TaxID=3156718 RepID=UPI0033FF7AA4
MNAGIQDAVNLGWKFAFTASRSGSEAAGGLGAEVLLDSYDMERRQAAYRRLILTHTAFWAEASTGRIPSWLRAVAAPRVAPAVPILLDRRRLVAEVIRFISQLRVNYRHSPLSVEGKPRLRGAPRPGDRLPDDRQHRRDSTTVARAARRSGRACAAAARRHPAARRRARSPSQRPPTEEQPRPWSGSGPP